MFGRYVKRRRLELGMTQDDLGVALERDQKYVSRLETDYSRFPDPEMFRRIAVALQVSPADLLVAAGYLDEDDAGRFREMRETAVVHDVSRSLDEAERQIAVARHRLQELQDERGVVVTGGRSS